jgi:hypothetical protein
MRGGGVIGVIARFATIKKGGSGETWGLFFLP